MNPTSTNNLSVLQSNLQSNINSNGFFEINEATLAAESGLSAPGNLNQLIQSSLFPEIVLENVTLKISGTSTISFALSNNNQTLTVQNITVDILEALSLPATVVFNNDNGTVNFTINAAPQSWSFGTSFPSITGVIEGLLDFTGVHLIFSTSTYPNYIWDNTKPQVTVTLAPGLNFASDYDLKNLPLVGNFITWSDSTFPLPTILFSGTMAPPEADAVLQVFPTLNINAGIEGNPKLEFPPSPATPFIILSSPSISLESMGFSVPNVTLNLTISIGSTSPVELNVKAVVLSNSDRLSIYISSSKDVGLEQLFDLIPGGSTVWETIVGTPTNPTFLADPLKAIQFIQFSIDFALGTSKSIISLQAAVGSTKALSFFDNQFTIESFNVNWLCLSPASNSQNLITLETKFSLPFIPDLLFDIVISTDKTITGSCTGTVSLSELIGYFNKEIGGSGTPISIPFDVSLSDFQLFMDFGSENKKYTFGATANAHLNLMGLELLAVKNAQISIAAAQVGSGANKTMQYQASMTGLLELFGIDFDVTAQIANGEDAETTVTVRMVNRTLGELLDMVVKFVSRNNSAVLPFPWSELNNIHMDALTLTLTMSKTKHQVTVTYSDSIDLAFIKISGITLTYLNQQTNNVWNKSTQVSLDCEFFGKSYSSSNGNAMAWDPVNGNPPPVPDQGTVLDIRYLGFGQHISLNSSDTATMQSVLSTLEKVALPPAKPLVPGLPVSKSLAHPLNDLPGLSFNGSSNWFIGADMTIMGAVSLGLIFNDPEMYGLIVSLSGPKVKALAGLQFEILYRKINDSIGEYYIELTLPTAMRHIEMGEVSITLPVIGIAIYTNGNFELDFGFPWNNDFSRSCGLQVFPFVGAGGFYFGVLDGATSNQVPKITGGSFNPVIVFGFGLQVGLGKSIDEGILSATAEITVGGILQGVLAFYEPDDKTRPSGHYFQLQGIVAISGVLSGSINFAIIQATVLVHVYADAQITYESYQPMQLGLDIGVEVEVSLKILFVHIHFSFSAHISESYTIGSASTPPWTLASESSNQQSSERSIQKSVTHTSFMAMRMAAPEMMTESILPLKEDGPIINWSTTGNAYFTTTPELALHFVPTPTALNPAAQNANNAIAIVAMLYTDSSHSGSSPDPSSFDNLVMSALAWALKNHVISGMETLSQSNAANITVSYEQICALHKALHDGPNGSPSGTDISTFLQNNFSSVTISPYDGTEKEATGAVFPMIPQLQMTYGTSGSCNFSTFNEVDKDYVNDVGIYLQALSYIPTDGDPVSFTGTESMAQMVFNDYFGLIIHGAVQAAKQVLTLYPYTVQTFTAQQTIQDQLNALGISTQSFSDPTFIAFVKANQVLTSVGTGIQINMSGLSFTAKGKTAQSLNGLSETLTGATTPVAADVANLLNTNLFVPNALASGSSVSLSAFTYTIPNNSSGAQGQVMQLFGTSATVSVISTPIPGAAAGMYNPYTQLLVQNANYTTSTNTETLNTIAYKFNTTPALLLGEYITKNRNGQAQGLYDLTKLQDNNTTLPSGSQLDLPDITYTVPPDSQYYIAAYFMVPISSLSIPQGSTYTPGAVVTISNLNYTLSDNMSFSNLGNYLKVSDLPTLSATIAALNIIAPGTVLTSPPFSYTTKSGDSPAIIAGAFNMNVDELTYNNLGLFFPATTVVNVPNATISVATLMTQLGLTTGTNNFNNISGQVSRFLLHGLRLPDPNQTAPILINGKANPNATTSPLYVLTGQQFDLGTATSVTLQNAQGAPAYIKYSSGTEATVSLNSGNMATLITSLKTTNTAFQFNFASYPLYKSALLRYTLQHSINWNVPHMPVFMDPPANSSVTANPSIWLFPSELKKKLVAEGAMTVNLMTGTRDPQGKSTIITQQVNGYRWSTLLDVKIKAISSPLSPVTGQLSFIYSLVGLASEDERHTLTALINDYKQDSLKPELYFLFDSSGSQEGVSSDLLDPTGALGDKVRIVKSNLSTTEKITGQQTTVIAEAGIQSDPLTFLELLWEGALLQNGGFYLQYQNAQGNGLPASLFTNGPETTVKMLVLCPTDVTHISSYHNSVALEYPVDLSRNALFIQSTNLNDYQSVMKPGYLGINVTCSEPQDLSSVQSYYGLITSKINAGGGFSNSTFTLPAGPVQQEDTKENTWDFHHILPIAQMFNYTGNRGVPGFPNPVNNPYNAVGATLDMQFYFQDIFGNLALAQESDLPSDLNVIGYYDQLIPLSSWPGVSASYDFDTGTTNGTVQLNVYFDFNLSKYLPSKSNSVQKGQDLASKDVLTFMQVYYQLSGPEVEVSLSSSMGTVASAGQAVNVLQNFTGELYQWANTIALLKSIDLVPQNGDTLGKIAGKYHISVGDLGEANKSVQNLLVPINVVDPKTKAQTTGYNNPLYYTVKFGDSINSIAKDKSIPDASSWALGFANDQGVLRTGTVIIISVSGDQINYTIQKGDTLTNIGGVYNVAASSIVQSNLATANIFADSIQLYVTSNPTSYTDAQTDLESIAKAWNITVAQLAEANATLNITITTQASVTVPLCYSLPPSQQIGDFRLINVSSNDTLSNLATANSVDLKDLFTANQVLLNVLETTAALQLPGGVTYTPDAYDTLYTLYNKILNSGSGNMDLDTFISGVAGLKLFQKGVILLPPQHVQVSASLTPQYTAELCEITASLCIQRTGNIDAAVPDQVKPLVTSVASNLTAHTASTDGKPASLKYFATKFETAFSNSVKVVTTRNASQQGTEGKHLFALPLVEGSAPNVNTLAYSLSNKNIGYFAPAPMANCSITINKVDIYPYSSSLGKGNIPVPVNFVNINMDQWAQTFLNAMQTFASAEYAVPASDLDVTSFNTLMQAKQNIASAISSSVIPILGDTPLTPSPQQLAAQETLNEALLQDLATAYNVDAIVQLDVAVTNSTASTPDTAIWLTGKPVLKAYKVKSTDTLDDIAANLFSQTVPTAYLAEILADVPGLIKNYAISAGYFIGTGSLTSQDSANIFNELVSNKIVQSNGILVAGYSKSTPLNLSPVYSVFETAISNLLETSYTQQQNPANQINGVIPSSSSTLNTIATAAQISLTDLINEIHAEQILNEIPLNFAWNAYKPAGNDTLATLADRFDVTIGNFVQANLLNTNLLLAQTITVLTTKVVVQPNETLETLLTQLNITLQDFSDPMTPMAVALANYNGLFEMKASAGILCAESAINLSTADIALTQNSSSLTFLLQKGNEGSSAIGENVFIDFKYRVNGLKKESGQAVLPGFEDYNTLSFILPFDTQEEISFEAPIPLREPPVTPTITAQKASFPGAHQSDLSQLKLWIYQVNYTQFEESQDEMIVKIFFNENAYINQAGNTNAVGPLFGSLANFITNWPLLEQDLKMLTAMTQKLPMDQALPASSSIPLAYFASQAFEIATNWLSWHEDMANINSGTSGDPNVYECVIQEFSDEAANFAVHIYSQNNNLPVNAKLVPIVIDDNGNLWVPNKDETSVYQGNNLYTYTDFINQTTTSDPQLTYMVGKACSKRQLNVGNLDILQIREVASSLAVIRNKDLINGQKTNPAFVFETPEVSYVNGYTPFINSAILVDIAKLPGAPNSPAPLVTYLQNLFTQLLEFGVAPTKTYPLTVECQYGFSVNVSVESLSAARAVLMHPLYDFTQADCGNDPTAYVQKLAAGITTWQQQHTTTLSQGRNAFYRFNITLFTEETLAKPYFELSNLVLSLANIQ